MSSETRTCQNCKQNFVIEPEDFKFYEKIKVPPPTWCPECRLIRRLAWRNEYTFYRRKCSAPGHDEELISTFSPDKPFPVYDPHFWWGDDWDSMNYGREYDFSRPFFEQFRELVWAVPKPSLTGEYFSMVNSDYSNWAGHLKNCYLITDADYVEDSAYGTQICRVKDSFDNDFLLDSQRSYFNFDVFKSYLVFFSVGCRDSYELYFCKNCVGCNNCFGSTNLRNKSYYIFNEPYTKEDYQKKLAELNLGSYKNLATLKTKVEEFWKQYPQKEMRGYHNLRVTGDYIYNSKNTSHGFFVTDVEDSKFVALTHARPTKDCFDYTDWGENAQLVYEGMSIGLGAYNIKFSQLIFKEVSDIEYSYFCGNSSSLFGCAGLLKKQYCILNKQYSKDDYRELVSKIKKHMEEMPYVDKKGRVYRYGEFFPPELAPFAHNETIIREFFPVKKEEVLANGWLWKDPEPRNYQITLKPGDIPDHIKDVSDSVLSDIIGCEHEGKCDEQCTTAFRLIPQEFAFLKRMGLPLPRLCPNCRHYQRIRQRNPLKLWHRRCECAGSTSSPQAGTEYTYKNTADHIHHKKDEPCQNEFETTYAPQRPEIVYCEQCYLREVV